MILVDKNKSDEPSNISLSQISQLISCILPSHIINYVTSITYLGHGDDFDSFCIDVDNDSRSAYVIRVTRHNNYQLIEQLKQEIKLLSVLKPYFAENGISINIPQYNNCTISNKHDPICSLLSNTTNQHKSHIYSTYPMIHGKQLCTFEHNQMNKLLAQNSDKLATILAILHQYNTSNFDKTEFEFLFETAGSEFGYLVKELQECQVEIPINDKELTQFIKTEIIDQCNNIIIPKWNKYETFHCNKQSNKFSYELIHGDLHAEHILLSTNDNPNNYTITGLIDWSDIMITDCAMEFRYLWIINTQTTLDMLDKYKSIRRFDKDRCQLFDLCVNIYGYITLVLFVHWSEAGWINSNDEKYKQIYINACKNKQQHWRNWVNKIINILSVA